MARKYIGRRYPGRMEGVWTGDSFSLVSSISMSFVSSDHVHLIDFPLLLGTMGSRWILRHPAGLLSGAGGSLCSAILQLE